MGSFKEIRKNVPWRKPRHSSRTVAKSAEIEELRYLRAALKRLRLPLGSHWEKTEGSPSLFRPVVGEDPVGEELEGMIEHDRKENQT
jgi:hypothetical protein